jgi:hypothetical protein
VPGGQCRWEAAIDEGASLVSIMCPTRLIRNEKWAAPQEISNKLCAACLLRGCCCCRTHISRAGRSESIFHFGSSAQDVAFLRNSFNKFRQAENILRPFLFSFVSGRRRRRCRAARTYNGRCQYTRIIVIARQMLGR